MSESAPVLLLGAGPYQIPLIDAVRLRGLRSFVLDGDPQAAGFESADASRVVDISNVEAVTTAAREIRPRAIAFIASEVPVRSAAAAAAALGLPGLDPEVALASTHKHLMRQRFAEHGLVTPRFGLVRSFADARRVAADVGYPLIAKPVDSSGSRGVAKVDDESMLPQAIEAALANSRDHEAILESFIEGVECTIEAFAFEGRIEVQGISDKIRVPFPHCVSTRLTYPSYFDAAITESIADVARRAMTAVGIVSGPAHVEVLVTPSGPVVVEVGARGGGYQIFSDIIREISGVDAVEAVLDLALGLVPSIAPTKSRAAVLAFFNPGVTGTVKSITHVDEARGLPHVIDLVIVAKPGSCFGGITRDGERPGYVITVADSRAGAVDAADRVERTVHFEIEPEARDS